MHASTYRATEHPSCPCPKEEFPSCARSSCHSSLSKKKGGGREGWTARFSQPRCKGIPHEQAQRPTADRHQEDTSGDTRFFVCLPGRTPHAVSRWFRTYSQSPRSERGAADALHHVFVEARQGRIELMGQNLQPTTHLRTTYFVRTSPTNRATLREGISAVALAVKSCPMAGVR